MSRIASLLTKLTVLALSLSGPVINAASPVEPPPDFRYQTEVLAVGLQQPMTLQIAADGRIFFNELRGRLRIWKPGGQLVEAGTLPVFGDQENGFLGLALDPDFAHNQWIYLLYSPTNFSGQRLSRFQMKGDLLDLASEQEVMRFDEQRRECCHHAGSLRFAPDGCLLISTGDNTNPAGDSGGYAPLDQRPDREPWDAQRTSANTASKNGKVLRIRPAPTGGYTIPDGNLFPKDGSGGCPEIYVMGCRNPWRMRVDERTGFVYWGEVGPDASNPGPRGPRGYDEINQARRAGNFGWPYFVGSNFPYARFDYATKAVGASFDPARPVNESTNNRGATVLPPAQPAFIYWPYADSPEFPMLGTGGRTACAGPVFHYKNEFAARGGFPDFYDNCLLFWDWQRPFIKWARLDADSRLRGIEPFTEAVSISYNREKIEKAEAEGKIAIRRPVDAEFGADGCLYLLDYGETWGPNPDSRLFKISYQRGNFPPTARVSITPRAGKQPLTIQLSSAGSQDTESGALRYEWSLHGPINVGTTNAGQPAPSRQFSTEANPTLTIKEPGNYLVRLAVRDSAGAEATATVPVVVGNTPPVVSFITPAEGDFFTPGERMRYQVRVVDAEDGDSQHYDDLMDARTTVGAQWTAGRDHEASVPPGLALMKQSDCFNCHSVKTKIVGPPLLDVANKYRNQPGAFEQSVQRVTHGSSGVWSDAPMLPHENLTTDQISLMVRWVFDLQPDQSGSDLARGLTGYFTAPTNPAIHTAVLEAQYIDQAPAGLNTLVGQSQIRLRGRRLEAELADVITGPVTRKENDASAQAVLGGVHPNHTVQFNRLDLQATESVTCRVACGGTNAVIELHEGRADGRLLARFEVAQTGWKNWVELTAPLKAPSARTDVVFTFGGSNTNRLVDVDWVQFNRANPPGPSIGR